MKTKHAINAKKVLVDDEKGKYGTYKELSEKYEGLWKDYVFVSKMLTDVQKRLLQQNRTLDKFREAYKYITEDDQN